MCSEPCSTSKRLASAIRPRVRGKFLFVGDQKLYVRGVTYGTFRPDGGGNEYPDSAVVERDFAEMAASGVNAVRTYTVPPSWLLDAAQRHSLYVMVGLPWEQHVAFLDDKQRCRDIERRVQDGVRVCAGHPSVLCYVIGSEIPASIVRWHGGRRVERFLERLYRLAKAEDPAGLVTYANFPMTEYLRLPFVDFLCFNVYLESPERFEAYLVRLQNSAGARPLVMAEIGLDSRRHGHDTQASALNWQVRSAFAAGCAGAFVFAWTDEWHRGGYDVDDWDFGLTGRDRCPKPALAAVRRAFAEVPFARDLPWPRTSVVVCSYNGARTIRDCFDGLRDLQYPDYEVIVVDDGSTDDTASIAHKYGFTVISTDNQGLSSARNTGLAAASGEIIAYLDDDAYPDPHWLHYLAAMFMTTEYAGIGGPNLAPPDDGPIADCVANSPGGPIHILLSDQEAEHVPGCNMAFRTSALRAIGGFDPQFRAAGDDVDACWRVQQQGWAVGFHHAAMVWHHRRNSVRAYWKQQVDYGTAEVLLERKWPEKYNSAGHVSWGGRVYGDSLIETLASWRRRVYHGTWGTALFQSAHQPAISLLASLPLMPEWDYVIVALAALGALGVTWTPLLVIALSLLLLAIGASLGLAGVGAARATFASAPRSRIARARLRGRVMVLHLLQPRARLYARLRHGLTPWRRGLADFSLPRSRAAVIWREHWRAPEEWLRSIEAALHAQRARVVRGGGYDRWDLEARGGMLGGVRLRMAVEEHGAGRQLLRFRIWPRWLPRGILAALVFGVLCAAAARDHAWLASAVLGAVATLLALRMLAEAAVATSAVVRALRAVETGEAIGSTPPAPERDGRPRAGAVEPSTPTVDA